MADAADVQACTRAAGCTCSLCDMSSAAMADAPGSGSGGAAIECTRSMGCKCSQCNMDLAALGDVTNSAKAGGSAAEPCAAGPATVYTFAALNYNADRVVGEAYDVEKDGKLGSVYTMLTEVLAARGDWLRAKAVRNTIEDAEGGKKSEELKLPRSFQLLLGTAQGKGIKFGQLGYGMWPPPLVNYYRGFNTLCRKASLIQTLREAATCAQEESQLLSMMPETFLFYPSHAEDEALNEHAQLAGAFEARAEALAAAGGGENIWILKPSDGAKGERIELMSELPKIQGFLKTQAESESTSGWVVQQYIDRPLLLRGGRKFDVRCWVLLDPDYKVYLYREGVLRTGAVAYSVTAENLDDKFIHLTNHCIAAKHPDFGKFEATNEMFYPEFDAYLQAEFAGKDGRPADQNILADVILPQFKKIALQSIEAARGQMDGGSDYYKSFHLFGYDFLIDADMKAWLCEVNASPAVAEELMPKLVRDLIGQVVDGYEHIPAFGDEQQQAALAEQKAAWAADVAKYSTGLVGADENGFELLSAEEPAV